MKRYTVFPDKTYAGYFTADDIRRAFYETIDSTLTTDTRTNAEDLARMSYIAQGAKLLADALIDAIEEGDE